MAGKTHQLLSHRTNGWRLPLFSPSFIYLWRWHTFWFFNPHRKKILKNGSDSFSFKSLSCTGLLVVEATIFSNLFSSCVHIWGRVAWVLESTVGTLVPCLYSWSIISFHIHGINIMVLTGQLKQIHHKQNHNIKNWICTEIEVAWSAHAKIGLNFDH